MRRLSTSALAAILLASCSNVGDDDDNGGFAGAAGSAPMMMGPVTMGGTPPPAAGMSMTPGGAPMGGVSGGPPMAVGGASGGAPMAGGGGDVSMMAGMGGDTAGAGTAGEGGTMATAGMGEAGGGEAGSMEPPMMGTSPCITKGSQVILIGDSYSNFGLAHESVASLMTKLAVKNGALMTGDRYVDYAAAGTTLQNTITGIPSQWQSAKRNTPIHLVIMDGGGNDVLIDNQQCLADGSQNNAGCQAVVERSMKVGMDLWTDMKATGVKDVIWFWYPHIPGSLAGTGHDINDYALEKIEAAAAAFSDDSFHVYIIDTIPIFEGHDNYFFGDGVHATTPGTQAICDAIWALMKENCIGQASGCCVM